MFKMYRHRSCSIRNERKVRFIMRFSLTTLLSAHAHILFPVLLLLFWTPDPLRTTLYNIKHKKVRNQAMCGMFYDVWICVEDATT